ncbi:transcriptional regulator [Companilactobacillus sp. RD055328]|uniref:helix-turn-helix domain-containing protein n=1 Tax=Companilactobacillus sp. RD055328 TaxID=2916634 RepID=UPI001FC8BC0C|nr:helix-turn-helix domain-containing protein [Companilactobacillus sp. RD055328]GKQ43175.1 transcriptional regulator [Companilactobacillus sp. RD055328]
MEKSNDLFLTSSDAEKLNLFVKITQIKVREMADSDRLATYHALDFDIDEINLRQVASVLKRSYGSIYNTYLGILSDMEEILDKKNPTTSEIFNVDPDRYHFYLVKNSHPYKFIMDCIINDECQSFEKFYERENSSKATVLRHLKPIRTIMKKFNLRLTYEPIKIIGDEKMIRLGLTGLIWNATRGYEWPFAKIPREECLNFVEFALNEFNIPLPDKTTLEFYATFVAVNTNNMYQGNIITNQDLSIMLLRYPYPNVVKYYREAHKTAMNVEMTSEQELLESAHYYLYITCMPTFMPQGDAAIQEITNLFEQSNPEVTKFVDEVISAFPLDLQKSMRYSDNAMQQFKNNFTAATVASIAFKGNYMGLSEFYLNYQLSMEQLDYPELRHMTLDTVQHVVSRDEYQSFVNDAVNIADGLYSLISRRVILNREENRVQVFIGMERFFLIHSDLMQMIESIPFVDINENIEEADLVIAESEKLIPEGINKNAYKFQWINDGIDGQYGELYSLIHEIWTNQKTLVDKLK